jgi:putative peptidoglycan lipid II flippase
MTVLVKSASVGKELVVAWRFGTGDELDAFFIAWLVPSLLIVVLADSFNGALIPVFVRVRELEGLQSAQKLLSSVVVLSLVFLGIATILMVLSTPIYLPLIAQGFSPEKLALTKQILIAISPIVPLSGVAVIWGAILNAGERFAGAAIAPISTPIISILFLLYYKQLGIFALPLGFVCGAVIEIIFLGIILKKQGFFLLPKWHGLDRHLRYCGKQYLPTLAGAFLMFSTTIVDQSMAASVSPGSVAALNYGTKFVSLPINLTATALSVAVIPYFSKMVAERQWIEIRSLLKRYLLLVFIITIPLTILFVTFSQSLVEILLQKGEFSNTDSQLVGRIQAFYALQIPFYIGATLVVRALVSMGLNHILIWAAGLNLLINIQLNYRFLDWLGVEGIALSTSCVHACSFGFVLLCLKYNFPKADNESR